MTDYMKFSPGKNIFFLCRN